MVYNETGASLAELFHLLLDVPEPVIWPAADIRTTAEKLERTIPDVLLMCATPSDTEKKKTGRGRPRKSKTGQPPEQAESSVAGDSAACGKAEVLQKGNSFAAFLYNGYNNVKARRAEMARVLKEQPAAVLREAEEKAVRLLYADGEPQFDGERLRDALLMDVCIPLADEKQKEPYRKELSYFYDLAPEKAFARAVLALLLAEQAQACQPQLFPADAREDDSPESLEETALALEARGEYKAARELWRQLLREGGARAADAACAIGKMFQNGLECRRDPASAIASFTEANELAAGGVHPAASYALYECFTEEKKYQDALEALRQSAGAGSPSAMRELGNLYYRGAEAFGIEKDISAAAAYYRQGAGASDAVSQRMLAKCLEALGRLQEADTWYGRAAQNGDEEAAYYWMQPGNAAQNVSDIREETETEDHTDRVCFFNADNESTRTFLRSLGRGWRAVRLQSENEMLMWNAAWDLIMQAGNGIDPCLEEWMQNSAADSRAIFFLFDTDTENNLECLVRITGRFNQEIRNAGEDNARLLENIRFFVRCSAGDETAERVVDTCNAAHEFRREAYFRITLCDPAKDASAWLLTHAPLFAPVISGRYRKPAVAVLGAGGIVPQLICDMLSVLPEDRDGKPLSITVIDEQAGEVKQKLLDLAPALFEENAPEKLPVSVSFMEVSEGDFFRKLEFNKDKDPAWERLRFGWNYYIAAGNDDRENLQRAVRLRETLTRMDLRNRPLIAAYVKSEVLSGQAARFQVPGERIGFAWYNRYDICCFGSSGQMYTKETLLDSPWKTRAFALHCAYYGDAGNHLFDAGLDYWSRCYNREASERSAMSGIYKLYLAGLLRPDSAGAGAGDQSPEAEVQRRELWERWLEEPVHEEKATRDEHIRWNYFVCSRGWRQASVARMQQYIGMGNPRQQLYLAKLHPCIVDWNRLKYVETEFNHLMQSRNPEWKDRDFIESDRIMVRNCWRT
ncbi:MAG: sel1 repeat family protein [Eubacterium sp.]|nr:sel1 repeat family protein [Eubacterium sp.]